MTENIITPPNELFEFFKKRTQFHCDLVYRNMMRFAITKNKSGLDFNSEIEKRAGLHDASKFEKPEVVGFIWLTSYYWLQQQDKSIEYTKDSSKQIEYVYKYLATQKGYENLDKNAFEKYLRKHFKIAFEHHYANNSHHPEYHNHLDEMTDIDLIEMVCDWTAMAQELGQDNGSAKAWADKMIGERFSFPTGTRVDFIYEKIEFLDEQNKFPMFIDKVEDRTF